MRSKSSKCLINLSYIRFCMHDRICGRGQHYPNFLLGVRIIEVGLYLLKYHCELNPIERNWCHAKKISCQYVNGTIVKLRVVVPTFLDAVTVEMMNKFFRTCRDYKMAYRSGCKGKEVEIQVKLYKSHRRVFSANS
jgi:hypothetical protein